MRAPALRRLIRFYFFKDVIRAQDLDSWPRGTRSPSRIELCEEDQYLVLNAIAPGSRARVRGQEGGVASICVSI